MPRCVTTTVTQHANVADCASSCLSAGQRLTFAFSCWHRRYLGAPGSKGSSLHQGSALSCGGSHTFLVSFRQLTGSVLNLICFLSHCFYQKTALKLQVLMFQNGPLISSLNLFTAKLYSLHLSLVCPLALFFLTSVLMVSAFIYQFADWHYAWKRSFLCPVNLTSVEELNCHS